MLQNKQQISVRNSSIELLRIISMIMIVFHHFAIHGGFTFGASISITHFWYNLIIMGGKIGVDIFVIISGYYLISNDEIVFNTNRIIKFVGQVFDVVNKYPARFTSSLIVADNVALAVLVL